MYKLKLLYSLGKLIRILIILWVVACNNCPVNGQEVKERVILNDADGLSYTNAKWFSFDRSGNYCILLKAGDKDYFFTNTDTIGKYEYLGCEFSNYGDWATAKAVVGTDKGEWYFKNMLGTEIFGPVYGEKLTYTDGGTHQNMAVKVLYRDSVYYYINHDLVSVLKKSKAKVIEETEWCVFSANGNRMYYTWEKNRYNLFVNGKQIDSSGEEYSQMQINDNGEYTYRNYKKLRSRKGKPDVICEFHTNDTIITPAGYAWQYSLSERHGYYYTGVNDDLHYIIVNDHLYDCVDSVCNIRFIDKNNYLFVCKEDGISRIVVNGRKFDLSLSMVQYPVIDERGNYAYFGTKDYYLYKVVNGLTLKQPITRFGIRPVPLYISPEGRSLVYYVTDDSTYFYSNDSLLFPPISNTVAFKVQTPDHIFPLSDKNANINERNSLFYVEMDTSGYFVFNGSFSHPMIPAVRSSVPYNRVIGEIVAGSLTEHGFFIIQKTGAESILININNSCYRELAGISAVYGKSCFFDGRELMFYGKKGNSICQFTVSL